MMKVRVTMELDVYPESKRDIDEQAVIGSLYRELVNVMDNHHRTGATPKATVVVQNAHLYIDYQD